MNILSILDNRFVDYNFLLYLSINSTANRYLNFTIIFVPIQIPSLYPFETLTERNSYQLPKIDTSKSLETFNLRLVSIFSLTRTMIYRRFTQTYEFRYVIQVVLDFSRGAFTVIEGTSARLQVHWKGAVPSTRRIGTNAVHVDSPSVSRQTWTGTVSDECYVNGLQFVMSEISAIEKVS